MSILDILQQSSVTYGNSNFGLSFTVTERQGPASNCPFIITYTFNMR